MKTIKLEVIEKPLSAREAMMLAEYEHTIVKDFAAFYRVGQALAEINRLRLYRTEEGRTFEQYCKKLWDMSKSKAYQLIDASGVYGQLQLQCGEFLSTNCGDSQDGSQERNLPLNEAQVRPLTKFKGHPEKIVAMWKEATHSAPNGKVTASHVNKVVKSYLGENIKKTVHAARQKVSQTCSAEFTEAFDAFAEQISEARKANYKHTSREMIIKALDQLRAELAEDGDTIEDSVTHGGSADLNKLEKAGFSIFRMDRSSMTIRQRSEKGGWIQTAGPYASLKEMDAAFKTILQNDMHVQG
ncbi:MAG TPA: hypothetical protein DCZ63_13045 [Geobacter sp.]|nr:hypothetical protein [Geobacter sp.]